MTEEEYGVDVNRNRVYNTSRLDMFFMVEAYGERGSVVAIAFLFAY